MPLSDDLKERLLGSPHNVVPESEPLRAKAKWHAERVGGLKNAKLAKVGQNIYHAELAEREHPGHDDTYAGSEGYHFAFR